MLTELSWYIFISKNVKTCLSWQSLHHRAKFNTLSKWPKHSRFFHLKKRLFNLLAISVSSLLYHCSTRILTKRKWNPLSMKPVHEYWKWILEGPCSIWLSSQSLNNDQGMTNETCLTLHAPSECNKAYNLTTNGWNIEPGKIVSIFIDYRYNDTGWYSVDKYRTTMKDREYCEETLYSARRSLRPN